MKKLSIGDVENITGLTARAIRLYESQGLLTPARTSGGRREYGDVDLAKLAAIQTLKEVSFPLSEIRAVLADDVSMEAMIDFRLATIERQIRQLQDAKSKLAPISQAISDGAILNTGAIIALIKASLSHRSDAAWALAWMRFSKELPPKEWCNIIDYMGEGHNSPDAKWRDLGRRIQESMPLDPTDGKAQEFLDEWRLLMSEFQAVATQEQIKLAEKFWKKVGDWGHLVDQPMSEEIIALMKAAAVSREQNQL